MRIGIITSPFGPLPPKALGAIERRWYYMGEHMGKKGHEIMFYAKKDSHYSPAERVQICQINGFKRSKSIYLDILKDFVFTSVALVKLRRCDIFIQNTFWAPILSPLVWWKYKRTVYNVARMPKQHFLLYPFVNQFSCVSSATQQALEAIIGKKNKIVTISNPVNLHNYTYVAPSHNPQKITIGYHGRIHKEKGLDLLCRAAQKLATSHNISLMFIGPVNVNQGGSGDEYLQELRHLCPDINIDYKGSIDNPSVLNETLSQCDIYCYPSVASGETFGVSPLEAMSKGLPVVVSDLACFKDFISDGENGLIFNHKDTNAVDLLSKRLELLINDDNLRQRLGAAAYNRAQDFSVENIAELYLDNFEKLIHSK